jgi:DNA repair exonuclease SbcCD ATPase subunit
MAQKELAGARALVAGSSAKVRLQEAELKALRTQLEAAQSAQQQGEAQAALREQALQQQLLTLRQESSARQQANQALVQILERSTTALADAEAKNRKLHAMGQDLVQRYTGRSPVDTALQQDPLLGLAAVRFEDEAEKLRAALHALQVR